MNRRLLTVPLMLWALASSAAEPSVQRVPARPATPEGTAPGTQPPHSPEAKTSTGLAPLPASRASSDTVARAPAAPLPSGSAPPPPGEAKPRRRRRVLGRFGERAHRADGQGRAHRVEREVRAARDPSAPFAASVGRDRDLRRPRIRWNAHRARRRRSAGGWSRANAVAVYAPGARHADGRDGLERRRKRARALGAPGGETRRTTRANRGRAAGPRGAAEVRRVRLCRRAPGSDHESRPHLPGSRPESGDRRDGDGSSARRQGWASRCAGG